MKTPLSGALFSDMLSKEGQLGLPHADDEPLSTPGSSSPASAPESCTLKIGGMTCGACVEVRARRACALHAP
jgi:hypothetical protein